MPVVRVGPENGKTVIKDLNDHSKLETESKNVQGKHVSVTNSELQKSDIESSAETGSVKTLWKEFIENTTLHGIKNARKDNKYHLRWIIWILALLGMGTSLFYMAYKLLLYYNTNPTLTNINVRFVKEIPFPGITICNLSPFKKSAVNASPVMTSHLLQSSRLGVIMPSLNYSDPANSELNKPFPPYWARGKSFHIKEMFVACVNKRVKVKCADIVSSKPTQWGACFTYKPYSVTKTRGSREKVSNTGSATALTFYINVNQEEYVFNENIAAGVKVVLHDPSEEPDVKNKGFILSPGFSTYVSMKMTQYKYLPAPYTAMGDQICVNNMEPGFINPLKYFPFYSRTGCLFECRRNFIVEKCSCRGLTDPGNETVCSPAQIATCYYLYEVEFDSNAQLKDDCRCQIPCEFVTFDQSISTAAFPADVYASPLHLMGYDNLKTDYLEVRLYYDSLSFLSVESIPEYNIEDIVGIVGGQMGIFLGASLLTLSELLEFIVLATISLTRRCCCLLSKETKDEEGLRI